MLLLFAGSILVVLNARGCWGHLVRLQASPHLTGRSGLGDACLAPSPCHPGHAYIPPPAAVVLLRATVRTYRGTSNIVFTNGALDPWSVFGVTADVSDSVVAVLIPDGAHHLDLDVRNTARQRRPQGGPANHHGARGALGAASCGCSW